MKFVLDDLLPPSDAAYEPPDNPGDLFTDNSALFEIADEFKYKLSEHHDRESFSYGYYAALFDVWLKTGLAFWMPVPGKCAEELADRARGFYRIVEVKRFDNMRQAHVTVQKHGEEAK